MKSKLGTFEIDIFCHGHLTESNLARMPSCLTAAKKIAQANIEVVR
jgi:hypothetical protein